MNNTQVLVISLSLISIVLGFGLILYKYINQGPKLVWKSEGCSEVYEDRGIKFLSFKSLMMADWDLVAEGKAADFHYSIFNREEAVERLRKLNLEKYCWAVYHTPNGVHAFLISQQVKPRSKQAKAISTALGMDELYMGMCKKHNYWSVRVSPKPGRVNDYVAQFKELVGNQETIVPELYSLLDYHDSCIER